MGDEKKSENPPVVRNEVHIIWTNGNVEVRGPKDPLFFMKILSDAMNAMVVEYLKEREPGEPSKIVHPGTGLPMIDPRLADAILRTK